MQPRALLAADLRVEEIELLVRVRREHAVDPLSKLILDTFPDDGTIAAGTLAEQKPVDSYVTRSVTSELHKAGLIQFDDADGLAAAIEISGIALGLGDLQW